jgi:hypothetical protein
MKTPKRPAKQGQTTPTRPAKRPTVRTAQVPGKDEKPLRVLEEITDKLAKVREQEAELRDQQIDAMFDCRHAGWSLRAIAEAANISNPRVHATLTHYAEDA